MKLYIEQQFVGGSGMLPIAHSINAIIFFVSTQVENNILFKLFFYRVLVIQKKLLNIA